MRAFEVFLPKKGTCDLSVDRLTAGSRACDLLERMAMHDSRRRHGPFQGWAFVFRDVAEENGRRVLESPTCHNPFHADIVFPEAARFANDERKRHAHELATAADWRNV